MRVRRRGRRGGAGAGPLNRRTGAAPCPPLAPRKRPLSRSTRGRQPLARYGTACPARSRQGRHAACHLAWKRPPPLPSPPGSAAQSCDPAREVTLRPAAQAEADRPVFFKGRLPRPHMEHAATGAAASAVADVVGRTDWIPLRHQQADMPTCARAGGGALRSHPFKRDAGAMPRGAGTWRAAAQPPARPRHRVPYRPSKNQGIQTGSHAGRAQPKDQRSMPQASRGGGPPSRMHAHAAEPPRIGHNVAIQRARRRQALASRTEWNRAPARRGAAAGAPRRAQVLAGVWRWHGTESGPRDRQCGIGQAGAGYRRAQLGATGGAL